MSEIRLNIHQAKTHLSRHLTRLGPSGRIVLCRRNVPIAEIRALPAARRRVRQIGSEKGKLRIPKSFFEPLSSDLLDAFEGK